LLLLEGNHDRSLSFHALKARLAPDQIQQTLTIDAWTIAHGHQPRSAARTLSGHHHPVLRVSGVGAPCFLAAPNQIILPAFSCNAAGCDVRTAILPQEWPNSSLYCFVSTGAEVLNFGPLDRLRARPRPTHPL
jgi:metallophosphoesterase superfamily enzyme